MAKKTMEKEERSLLLFLETCAVDGQGRVKTAHMNEHDMRIAKEWTKDGYIEFGRIAHKDVSNLGDCWVHLGDQAWQDVQALRRQRADRVWKAKRYETTEEVRNGQ